MARIFVSPLSHLHDTIRMNGARDVLTLATRPEDTPDLSRLGVVRRGLATFADITQPREGYALAGPPELDIILRFCAAWDRQAPLVIHCFAGISRSPAAAYIAACALMPDSDEKGIAEELRGASPSATPNIHLIGLADAMLDRNGRMIAAIRAIGRGAEAFEGEVFCLDVPGKEASRA